MIAERGDEGIELVRELAGGDGTHTVLECVGTSGAIDMALGVVTIGLEEVPQGYRAMAERPALKVLIRP